MLLLLQAPRAGHRHTAAGCVQADAPLAQEDAERRERVLPVALAAMEAALRRATDALGASPHRDSCDFAVQARPCVSAS